MFGRNRHLVDVNVTYLLENTSEDSRSIAFGFPVNFPYQ